MPTLKLKMAISGTTPSHSNALSNDLTHLLEDSINNIIINREKTSSDTLDIGTILVAVISSQFAVEALKVIAAWVMKNPTGEISIDEEQNEQIKTLKISGKGLKADQIEKIIFDALR